MATESTEPVNTADHVPWHDGNTLPATRFDGRRPHVDHLVVHLPDTDFTVLRTSPNPLPHPQLSGVHVLRARAGAVWRVRRVTRLRRPLLIVGGRSVPQTFVDARYPMRQCARQLSERTDIDRGRIPAVSSRWRRPRSVS